MAEEGGGDRWSLDHLFVDQDGIPTLVEVKRGTAIQIRGRWSGRCGTTAERARRRPEDRRPDALGSGRAVVRRQSKLVLAHAPCSESAARSPPARSGSGAMARSQCCSSTCVTGRCSGIPRSGSSFGRASTRSPVSRFRRDRQAPEPEALAAACHGAERVRGSCATPTSAGPASPSVTAAPASATSSGTETRDACAGFEPRGADRRCTPTRPFWPVAAGRSRPGGRRRWGSGVAPARSGPVRRPRQSALLDTLRATCRAERVPLAVWSPGR